MRNGLLGKKLGMTRVFGVDGTQYAVTVLQVEPHEVLFHKTKEKHGYDAVVVGTCEVSAHKLTKPMRGYFKALGCERFFRRLRELRLDGEFPEVGFVYSADIFQEGAYVDVTGTSIGKGFAGGMKRHNFGGLRASHGVSVSHRSHGSTGNREDPGKVFKGKKMAGHLGCAKVSIQNLVIHDVRDDLLLIRGGVPGPKGGYVLVRDAIKRK